MKQKIKNLPNLNSNLREVIFGMEDGMVSTLGALTGVAIGSMNAFTVLLAGLVIITVESISMGIGSYISNKSIIDVIKQKISTKKLEISKSPKEQTILLEKIYLADGWPPKLANQMATTAAKNKKMFLQEMAFHGLRITPEQVSNPTINGIFMFFSYVIGGSIPLMAYIFLPVNRAMTLSIIITLIGLFCLGVGTSRFTKRTWWRAGLELLVVASIAALVGYFVGYYTEIFLNQ